MFRVDSGNKMTIINGDSGSFDVFVENYTFVEGDEITFTVASSQNYREPLIQKVLTKGGKNLDSDGDIMGYFNDDNSCTFIIHPKDTAKKSGSYLFDIQLNLVDGRVDTIIGPSTLVVQTGITHRKLGQAPKNQK